MNILQANIECTEKNYCAYLEKLDGIAVAGSSVAEIRAKLATALAVYIEACQANGLEIPEELQGDYKVEFKMNVKSLLALYSGIFTKAGLERLTGINQKQLWHYASGKTVPRKAQTSKIEQAIHRLGWELLSVQL